MAEHQSGETVEDLAKAGASRPRGEGEELLARMDHGDESALADAISAFGGSVFGTAWRCTGNAALAEEVAQDVFLTIWLNPHRFDATLGDLRSYLVRVARNKAIDLVRREQTFRGREQRVKDLLEDPAAAHEGTVPGPARAVEQRELVVSALSALTPLQRETIVLVYFGGRTCREAAAELGVPEGTVKTRLRDALLKLRTRDGNP